MKFTIIKEPLPYLYIEEIFTEYELQLIYQELEFLHPKLKNAESTGSAVKNGIYLKKNTGVFLDKVFSLREFSNLLNLNRKFFSEAVINSAIKCCLGYGLLKTTNSDNTLISYYENADYYKPHADACAISIVTWFFKQPKNFKGGDFTFTDYNITIEPKNNSGVIFFSNYLHEVSSIQLLNNLKPMSGRFSMSMFCNHL
jgi:hypothetical protein